MRREDKRRQEKKSTHVCWGEGDKFNVEIPVSIRHGGVNWKAALLITLHFIELP